MPGDVLGLGRGPYAPQLWGPDHTLWLLCEIRIVEVCCLHKIMRSLTFQVTPFLQWEFWNHTGPFVWNQLGKSKKVVCFHPEE